MTLRTMSTYAVLTTAAATLCGCGGGSLCGSTPPPPGFPLARSTQAGRVVLPPGFPYAASVLTVRTSSGRATVDNAGEFVCPTFAGGLQFVMALTQTGKPMLIGWLDETHTEISATSTAEVLLYYAAAGPFAPGQQKSKLVGLVHGRSEVVPVANAIATAVAADPEALFDGRQSIAEPLRAAKAALMASGGGSSSARARGRDILIDPSASRSGLTLNQENGSLNSVYFTNRYRRRSYAFVDRVSYSIAGTSGDIAIPSPASEGGFDIEPVNGVSTIFGTIGDIALGNLAYTEKSTSPKQLSLTPDTAKKTTYQVTVVGWGREQGDFARLNDAQRARYGDMVARSLVCDFFLPIFLNVIIPAGGEKIDELCSFAAANNVAKDFIGALTQSVPGIWQKAESGDMNGAVWDALQAMQHSDSLKAIFLQLVLNAVTDAGEAVAFEELAQKFLRVLTAGDAALTGLDTLIQCSNYAQSNRADMWNVDVTAPNLKLQPDPAVVTAGLDTSVSIWGLGGTGGVLDFLWSTSGAHGHLEDDRGNSGKQFQSSQSAVRYVADAAAKDGDEDTINVSVRVKQNLKYVEIGKAQGSVFIVDVKRSLTIEPTDPWCFPDDSCGLSTFITPSTAAQVEYDWTCSSSHGVLRSASDQPAPFTTTTDYVTFGAGTSPGADTASVTAWMKGTGGKRIPIGSATRQITVRDPNAVVRKIAYIDPDWTLIQATPPVKWFASMAVYAVWRIEPGVSGYLITETRDGVQKAPYYRAANLLLRKDTIGHGCRDDEGGIMNMGYSFIREQDINDPSLDKPPAEWWLNAAADFMVEYNSGQAVIVKVEAVR